MKRIYLLPILFFVAATAVVTGCNKGDDYHSMSIEYPSSGLKLVSGEGGMDSLVFVTTESFNITTTVTTTGESNTWYSFPDAFNSYTSTIDNQFVLFNVPITFQRNESNHQRTVVFNINAGDYSVACAFVQDTLHAEAPTTPEDEVQE